MHPAKLTLALFTVVSLVGSGSTTAQVPNITTGSDSMALKPALQQIAQVHTGHSQEVSTAAAALNTPLRSVSSSGDVEQLRSQLDAVTKRLQALEVVRLDEYRDRMSALHGQHELGRNVST